MFDTNINSTDNLSEAEKLMIDSYFKDSLRFILETYRDNNDLGFIYGSNQETVIKKLGRIDGEDFSLEDISRHKHNGVWKHIVRIRNLLDHPCPSFILAADNFSVTLNNQIKQYIIDQIGIELFKLQAKKKDENKKRDEENKRSYYELPRFLKNLKNNPKSIPANSKLAMVYKWNDVGTNDDAQAIEWLAEALESGNCPEGLFIDLKKRIDDDGLERLAKALATGKCPKNLKFNFEKGSVTKRGACALARSLESGNCPEGLTIDFRNEASLHGNRIADKGALAIANAIASKKCPKNFKLYVNGNDISSAGIIAINRAIATGNYPIGFTSDYFDYMYHENLEIAKSVAEALSRGNFPSNVSICLCAKNGESEIIQVIVAGLESEKCPSGLAVSLRGWWYGADRNCIGNDLAFIVAKGIASGHFPAKLRLDLSFNGIDAKGAEAIANALISGHCPEEFELKLSSEIGIEGALAIKKALSSGKCPPGLKIKLNDCRPRSNEDEKEMEKIINEGMKNYEIISYQRLCFLHQGQRQPKSRFYSVPEDVVNQIVHYVDPDQAEKCSNIYKKFTKSIPSLCEVFVKLKVLPDNMLNQVNISDKLSRVGINKAQMMFSDDVPFDAIKLVGEKLQQQGLRCEVYQGSSTQSGILINLDIEETKHMFAPGGNASQNQLLTFTQLENQSGTMINFHGNVPFNEIEELSTQLNDAGFNCRVFPPFVNQSYIKFELSHLNKWLHEKVLPMYKPEKNSCRFFQYPNDEPYDASAVSAAMSHIKRQRV